MLKHLKDLMTFLWVMFSCVTLYYDAKMIFNPLFFQRQKSAKLPILYVIFGLLFACHFVIIHVYVTVMLSMFNIMVSESRVISL